MKATSKITRICLSTLTALAMSAVADSTLAAELAWREVSHLTESHLVVLPETGGYTVGAGKGSGLAFFKDGQVALVTLSFSIDYLKGDGTFVAYEAYTFPDGSAFSLKRNGRTVTVNGGAGAQFDGTFDLFNGKGRYAAIKGQGRFTGTRVAPLSSGADQYFDFRVDPASP